ncbi:helix-turn-helix transcriptional regulator [Paraflavitalea speifideaquila]|uniref:helix-turn-helix transcriptional regulator n=1 Tax=Paraflavitalea speifideaquila TaxID=3076558 RepID=UPI0028EABBFF|nr:sigma factor-like helix-turn-helix DNA-binding protein [Paraflavitalea speifideiaquila]
MFKYIFFNGFTTDQIARQLNISPQTVINQKTRALKLLRLSLLKKDLLPTAITFYYFALIFYQLTASL